MVNLNEWCCPLIHNMEGILSMWQKGRKERKKERELLMNLSGENRVFGGL